MSTDTTRVEGSELNVSQRPSYARMGAIAPLRRPLTDLSLPRQLLVLAVWPLLEQLLGFLVGFVDVALAGRHSIEATNAIGVAAYIGWLIGLVQSALGIGSIALIARAVGGGRHQRAQRVLGQSMLLAPLAGLAIGAIVFALTPHVARFAKLSGPSLAYCITYLRIISSAAPFGAILFVGSACLRGAGDTRTPFLVLVVVNLVNASLSWLLVMGPAPWGGHGPAGIAWGTFIAWGVGAILIVAALASGAGGLRLRARFMRPVAWLSGRILRLAAPNLVESLLGMWVVNFIVIRFVGMLGDSAAWGAHLVAIRIEAISYMPGYALGIAAATLAGQHLGAGRPDRARRAVIACWGVGVGVMACMGLMFILMPEPLVRLVTDKPEILAVSPHLLRMCGFVQIFFGTAIILGQAMRGAGDTRGPMVMTAVSTYLVRLPLAGLLGVVTGWGLRGLWIGLCAELTFRGCLFGARFLQGGWLKARV